ncbi:uncharacterized protein EAE97_000328 [Botrytis byssoidea]|uniref:Uncharacterized protein n=1 Tax=Botrytis byssoidea TaxID=139641 RepID=A0A9P5IV61_9HELO|nr:uncharacterized protein EAE97_000328 [Botrytis byssoidea]KAF7955069.1 hypothetical protein EAE97_000328 [Botrytis byssoidea]
MSYTNQNVPSRILGQRNFAYAINQFPARSPILGGRDSSENESDDASVTNSTTTHQGMSRGNATGRSNPWQPPTTSRKPLTAMARPGPERQLSSSPEYTPASPSFATAGSTNPRSPVFAARNPNFNPSSSGPSNALYAHYQAQPQSPTSGPYLPDYQSPGMNYQEQFTSYRARPGNFFALQPPPMLPSLTSNFFRNQGSMNNSNSSWTHSNVSRRKRLSEEDDDFFAPPSKRRHYSFGFYNETTARATDQTLQNSRNRVYISSNYGTTPADGDVEMNSYRAPESSNIYSGMVYQAAPSTPRGRVADDYNGPLATFPGDIEYTTTETAYGPNYSGEPGLVIQQKPTSTLARDTSSFDSAVATKPNHLPQILPRLPPLGTMFSGLSSIQSPQASLPSSNNDYPTGPRDNINHDNILSPTPQRSIRAEVFHSLEARDASVDPLILHSYAPSPALSEGSTHDAENQNSNENPPVETPQEENSINRHDTDSVTLAEDTPRQSIEVPDDTDNESVVSHHSRNNNADDNESVISHHSRNNNADDNESVISHHSRNNNVDDNNNQLLILQEEVTDLGVELYGVQRELSNHRENFEAFYTLNTEYSTEIPTISGSVERLERRIQTQSDETTLLRNEINTLRAEASEQRSRFSTFMDLVVEVADQSNLHGEQINQLTQREARAQIEIANNATANKVDELATLKREITRLQNRVLTLQNEALEKQIAELLRASSGL